MDKGSKFIIIFTIIIFTIMVAALRHIDRKVNHDRQITMPEITIYGNINQKGEGK